MEYSKWVPFDRLLPYRYVRERSPSRWRRNRRKRADLSSESESEIETQEENLSEATISTTLSSTKLEDLKEKLPEARSNLTQHEEDPESAASPIKMEDVIFPPQASHEKKKKMN